MKALRCCFAGIAVMLLSVVCIMMLKGMVAFAYETAGAEIPVYCLRCTADGSREYRLRLRTAEQRARSFTAARRKGYTYRRRQHGKIQYKP